MKKMYLIMFAFSFIGINAQWSLTGNSATDPDLNFIGTTDSKDLVLKTNASERIRITNSGSVGIGGAPGSNISLRVYGKSQVLHTADSDAFYVANDLTTNLNKGIDLVFLRYGSYQPNNPGVITASGFTSPGNYEAFFTLRSNGKMALGTTNVDCPNCNGYRLFVKEGIKTEKVKVEISVENGWADYVFKENYKLMPLKEVENYIKENGHLPEVPNTEEAIQNGIELKEMNILLLKKIEELTLHLIEQNKRIEALEGIKK